MILKILFGNPLEKGTKAPEFALSDQSGTVHKLSEHLGKWVVVYFYPKDNTRGCTQEACSFRDGFDWFRANKIPIYGISTDDVASHRGFSDAHSLPFPILADVDRAVSRAYGVLAPIGIAHRVTFLVDPRGVIADRIEWAKWSSYAERVKERLQPLLT